MRDMQLEDWAERIIRDSGRGLTANQTFWKKVEQSFENHVAALNTALSADRHSHSVELERTECRIVAKFAGHQSKVGIDLLNSRLLYSLQAVVDAEVSGGLPKATEIFVLNLSADSFSPRLTRQDGSQFGHTDLRWPVADQLSTFLLQKLTIPNFVDERFEQPS